MVKELLEVYDLKGKFLKVQERKKFYAEIKKEFKKTGKITKQVKSIRGLVMNPLGHIFIQKRNKFKEGNAGLYDKTIAGHVREDCSFDITLIKECAEELAMPAAVLSSKEFTESIHTIDLKTIGLFRKVDFINNFQSIRKNLNGSKWIQPWRTTIYIGYYDGSIRFSDKESSGIEVFSLKDLNVEIKKYPERFTEDLKFMIDKYKRFLKPLK
jgi:isopentenyldiphosphate isomerase